MRRITELIYDVLINRCHTVDFGSDWQFILTNLKYIFSIGTSMLFFPPLNSLLCAPEVLQCSGCQENLILRRWCCNWGKFCCFCQFSPTLEVSVKSQSAYKCFNFPLHSQRRRYREVLCFHTRNNWKQLAAPGPGPCQRPPITNQLCASKLLLLLSKPPSCSTIYLKVT